MAKLDNVVAVKKIRLRIRLRRSLMRRVRAKCKRVGISPSQKLEQIFSDWVRE